MTTTMVRPRVRPGKDEAARLGLIYQEMWVDPALAEQWLGFNDDNRKRKDVAIRAFAADMKQGRWRLNGECIKFAGSPDDPIKLLDGQNRLYAVVLSQTRQRLGVFFYVPDESQITMDSGTKRSFGDNLTMRGVKNSAIVAAVVGLAIKQQQGRLTNGQLMATTIAQEQFLEEHPEIVQSAGVASRFFTKSDVAPSIVGYTHWLFARIDPVEALQFWQDAAEKIGLPAGDPVLTMTSLFANMRRAQRSVPIQQQVSAVIRAWNYRRTGERISRLHFESRSGAVAIPEPR